MRRSMCFAAIALVGLGLARSEVDGLRARGVAWTEADTARTGGGERRDG